MPDNSPTPTELTPAQRSRQVLAEAQASLTDAKSLHDQHQTAAEELDAHLSSGRASVADLDTHADQWMRALATEQVAANLVKGCEANVQRATAGLINDNTAVADLFADVLADVNGGHLPIRVVTLPTDVKPNENGESVLFILQDKAPTNEAGILSANLALTYFRPPLYAPLDGHVIEEACRARNYAVDFGAWSPIDHGKFIEDPARVRVRRIFPTVPTLSTAPSDGEIGALANDAFNRIRNAVSYHGQREGVHLMGSPDEGRAKATLIGYKVISRSLDEET
jgi:hypothetical protein